MNPNNRWVKKAAMIPLKTIEAEYAKLFSSHTGLSAKPLRMALGSLLIQKQYHYLDEELVEQIRENPYYQYFIGLPGYEDKIPFVPSLLVEFRKRLSEDLLNEINELIALNIIAMNIDRLAAMLLRFFPILLDFEMPHGLTENSCQLGAY
jgi:hypothetical protein